MRISDWSSDVCSSDLFSRSRSRQPLLQNGRNSGACVRPQTGQSVDFLFGIIRRYGEVVVRPQGHCAATPPLQQCDPLLCLRSEEHTSELQSLMRISYAVFCLTKKNTE